MEIIYKLLKYQLKNDFPDSKMGELTGYSRQRWQQIRTNPDSAKKAIPSFFTVTLKNFPQYKRDLFKFIEGSVNGN